MTTRTATGTQFANSGTFREFLSCFTRQPAPLRLEARNSVEALVVRPRVSVRDAAACRSVAGDTRFRQIKVTSGADLGPHWSHTSLLGRRGGHSGRNVA